MGGRCIGRGELWLPVGPRQPKGDRPGGARLLAGPLRPGGATRGRTRGAAAASGGRQGEGEATQPEPGWLWVRRHPAQAQHPQPWYPHPEPLASGNNPLCLAFGAPSLWYNVGAPALWDTPGAPAFTFSVDGGFTPLAHGWGLGLARACRGRREGERGWAREGDGGKSGRAYGGHVAPGARVGQGPRQPRDPTDKREPPCDQPVAPSSISRSSRTRKGEGRSQREECGRPQGRHRERHRRRGGWAREYSRKCDPAFRRRFAALERSPHPPLIPWQRPQPRAEHCFQEPAHSYGECCCRSHSLWPQSWERLSSGRLQPRLWQGSRGARQPWSR